MRKQELKVMIKDAIELEGQLIDLIKECFQEIFHVESNYIISEFEQDLEGGMEFNGCIQPLRYYKTQMKRIRDSKENQKEGG